MNDPLSQRMAMPEPLTGRKVVRQERQAWQRLGKAEGDLDIGWDARGRPVRIEYHWKRYLSRADPQMSDVYTAELWVRQEGGEWLYLLRPDRQHFERVEHAAVRMVLARHLGIDTGV